MISKPAPGVVEFSIALVAGVGAGLVTYSISTTAASGILLVFSALYAGLAVWLFTRISFWMPMFIPLAVAVPGGYLFALTYKLFHFKRDRAVLRDILSKFVPLKVRDVLIQNIGKLGNIKETTSAACVTTDVEKFSELCNTLSSEQVVDLLREYCSTVFKLVGDYGGFISDLKGDSILAIWTNRSSEQMVRERVCEACLELQAAVRRFNQAHPERQMRTRIRRQLRGYHPGTDCRRALPYGIPGVRGNRELREPCRATRKNAGYLSIGDGAARRGAGRLSAAGSG